jgi:hypothetical protein
MFSHNSIATDKTKLSEPQRRELADTKENNLTATATVMGKKVIP